MVSKLLPEKSVEGIVDVFITDMSVIPVYSSNVTLKKPAFIYPFNFFFHSMCKYSDNDIQKLKVKTSLVTIMIQKRYFSRHWS